MADDPSEKIALEYGFKWFEYHATQRMTSFNFFLLIYSGLSAAESFLLREKIHPGSLLISISLILMSIIFWQLDVRSRQLIDIGELIVSRSWPQCGLDEALDPIALAAAKRSEGLRFKQLFGAVFVLGGLAGIGMFIYAMYLTAF
jgi:hypothetical protein